MNNVVQPFQIQLDIVDALVTLSDWVGAKLHLGSNDFTPTEETVLLDFTEAIFSGYAAQSLTWSDAFFDVNGIPVSSAGEKLFVQTGATGDLIYVAWITNTAGTKLLASGRIAGAPFTFINEGDAMPVGVKIGFNDGTIALALVP